MNISINLGYDNYIFENQKNNNTSNNNDIFKNKNTSNITIYKAPENLINQKISRDDFIEKGSINIGENYFRICKTKNYSSNCNTYEKGLNPFRKTGFTNSLISLKNKRNNKLVKAYFLDLFFDNILKSVNKMKKIYKNQSGGMEPSTLIALSMMSAYFIAASVALHIACKLFKMFKRIKFRCSTFSKWGVAIGLLPIFIGLLLASEGEILQGMSGFHTSSSSQNKRKPREVVGGLFNGTKRKISELIKTAKEEARKIINDPNFVGYNTHYFEIKNVRNNQNLRTNQEQSEKYFIKVKFYPFRKMKVLEIVKIKDLSKIKKYLNTVPNQNNLPRSLPPVSNEQKTVIREIVGASDEIDYQLEEAAKNVEE